MARKSVSGFAEAGAAMAQQLDDNDLLNLFSAVGRVVSKRFLMKRPSLNRWQLVIDYLTSAMAFEPREQFRVLYLDKRNNLIADEVLAEGTVDHTPVYPREVLRRAIELHATGCEQTEHDSRRLSCLSRFGTRNWMRLFPRGAFILTGALMTTGMEQPST